MFVLKIIIDPNIIGHDTHKVFYVKRKTDIPWTKSIERKNTKGENCLCSKIDLPGEVHVIQFQQIVWLSVNNNKFVYLFWLRWDQLEIMLFYKLYVDHMTSFMTWITVLWNAKKKIQLCCAFCLFLKDIDQIRVRFYKYVCMKELKCFNYVFVSGNCVKRLIYLHGYWAISENTSTGSALQHPNYI